MCSGPKSRRHVENVHNVGEAAARCARRETCTRKSAKQPPPTQPSDSPTRTTQHTKVRKSTWHNAPSPPAKIARFGSDVAARYLRATLRAAVLQVPEATSKMSTALEPMTLPAARGMRLAHAISKPNLRPLNHPIPQPKQNNTQRYENKHGYTYLGHQRRSRLRHSAAMWLQDNIELH